MFYIIQRNDGSTWTTKNKGEAIFWAMISLNFSLCNVYKMGGSGVLLSPYDIL